MKEKMIEMVPVPLPTEIPPPPSLENIPLEILHSATVEMLIQQNEDLSSRLKVNIRRNSQLEQRLISNEKEMAELNRKRENVLAQIEIIKEKEKIWSTQKQDRERQAETLTKEADLLELRYNELYTTSQQKDKARQSELVAKQRQIESLEKKLRVLQKVRVRAKEKLRGLLLDMARGLQSTHQSARQSESSNRMLKKHFSDLKTEITEKENHFKEQLENLKTASKNSLMAMDQRVTELRERNQALMTQKEELQQEISELTLKLHEEKKNRIRIAQITEELTELRNERIRFKREFETLLEKSEESRQLKNGEFQRLKTQFDELEDQRNKDKKSLNEAERKILEMTKDSKVMADQIASMQNLWMEAQAKLEKEELRSQALEKINRQLSQQAQQEKVVRATSRAHQTEDPMTNPLSNTEASDAENDDPFKKKIQNVFASQYRTMAKPPAIDL